MPSSRLKSSRRSQTLKLADDAFGLVDPPLAVELKTKAAKLGPIGSVNVFDGKEADYLECYRVLQGAEIWQSLGPWITHHKPRFADDIAQRFAGAAAITPDDIARYAPIRAAIRDRIRAGSCRQTPPSSCRSRRVRR